MHDFTESAEPPEVLEAQWDLEQVERLFDDLHQGAEIQHVQVRTTSDRGAQDRVATLGEAQGLLQGGQAKAIQVRYRFDNQNWCDTLMIEPAAVRVIRTRLSDQ